MEMDDCRVYLFFLVMSVQLTDFVPYVRKKCNNARKSLGIGPVDRRRSLHSFEFPS